MKQQEGEATPLSMSPEVGDELLLQVKVLPRGLSTREDKMEDEISW